MAITKKTGISSLSSRKEVRKILTLQLENSLAELKNELGEEKFNLRLKKAVKALTKDFEDVIITEEVTIIEKKEPIAKKLPSKVKKAAIKKVIKKKAVKTTHPVKPSKSH